MNKGNLMYKIFGTALVFVMIGVVLPCGALPLGNQALAQTPGTGHIDDDGAGSSGVNLSPVWRMSGTAGDLDLKRVPLECDNETIVDSWTLDSNGAVGSSSIAEDKTFDQTISSISGDTVVVQLELLDIPTTLTFQQDFVPDHWVEYEWCVLIDVDNDPDTGGWSGWDVRIALQSWKQPDSEPYDATIIEGTSHKTWIYDQDTEHWYTAHEVDVTVDYASNTVTMVGSKEWEELNNLDEDSRFWFYTFYYSQDEIENEDTTSCAQGSGVTDDPMGDVPYDFIDIVQGSLTFEMEPGPWEETVIVRLELLDIPSMLTFDRDSVPDSKLEYQWAIYIDVDNNPNTGNIGGSVFPRRGYDVQIALLNFKGPDETPHDAAIIEGTQHNTWIWDGDSWVWGHEIDVTVDYASNTITMMASKAWQELSNLDENSRFCFHTAYYIADGAFETDTTADSQGSGVIDDPVGDVAYDFIDIMQGSLSLSGTLGSLDSFADLGNPDDEATHNLVGWGDAQGPPENPYVSPSGDQTKRYMLLRGDNSLDLWVKQVGVDYTLAAEVEDGRCTDNFQIFVNGQGPIYPYQGKNAGTSKIEAVPHYVLVPKEYITGHLVTVTFHNTSEDECGLAAVYNVRLAPRQVVGFEGDWGRTPGYQNPWGALTHLSWFCVEPNTQGDIVVDTDWKNDRKALVSEGHASNVMVTLTVYADTAVNSLLPNQAARNALALNLRNLIVECNFDGVVVDFEYPSAANAANFVSFIQTLRAELDKNNPNYFLDVCIPNRTGNDGFNLANLKNCVDSFLMMAYDYNSSTGAGAYAGPNSPLFEDPNYNQFAWVDWTVEYYFTQPAPHGLNYPEKFILLCPTYGIDWATEGPDKRSLLRASSFGRKTKPYLRTCIEDPAAAQLRWDSTTKSVWYPYKDSDENNLWRVVWFDDTLSLRYKYAYASAHYMGGVGFWLLGYEGQYTEIYQSIRNYDRSNSSVENEKPYTSDHQPAPGSQNVPTSTNLVVHIRDDGAGVDRDSIIMTVNEIIVSPTIGGSPADYALMYQPATDFPIGKYVTVTIDALDLFGNMMDADTYSFRVGVGPVKIEGVHNCPPIDLVVVDPEGLTIDSQSSQIPGATYAEIDLNGDGDPDDVIDIPEGKVGQYKITVVPDPSASPQDTYSVTMTVGGKAIVLADNVRISDIPDQPYVFDTTAITEEIQLWLQAGWNMVSVPVTPADNSTSAVFPGVAGVFTWNSTSRSYYEPTVIEPEKGYWVAVTSNMTIMICGVPIETRKIDIKAGWNMIGSISTNSSIADPNDDPDGSVIPPAYWWNPVSRSYNSTTDIEPGKGYWIASVNDCTLIL